MFDITQCVAVAVVAAALGFSAGWKVTDWRYGAREKDRAEQVLVDERLTATAAIRRSDAVAAAQNAATVRLARLRVDAAGSRTALISLYDAATSALLSAETSHSSCIDRAAASANVLKLLAGLFSIPR